MLGLNVKFISNHVMEEEYHKHIAFTFTDLSYKCCEYVTYEQVPVANGSGSYPFSIDVPRNTRFLFANRTVTPSKAIAKSIVRFLLLPSS